MRDRIKKVRKHFDLTQTEFGNRLGLKGNTITNYETGLRIPSETVIVAICREFNVNRKWLETGEGEMFLAKESDTLKKISARYNGSDTFRAVLDAYVQLNPTEQDAIERYIDLLAQAIASGQSPETVAPPETSFRNEMESEGYTPKARPDREQAE